MNHFLIIIHFLLFTSGIVLITLTNFLYPKFKSPVIKHLLLADIFYTALLLFDTFDLYFRKNISANIVLMDICFRIGQFAAGAVGIYFLIRLTYDITGMELVRIKRFLSMGLVVLMIFAISLIYVDQQFHTLLTEYIMISVDFIVFLIFAYCFVMFYRNSDSVNITVKKVIYYCIPLLLLMLPLSFVAKVVKCLPVFVYKIPYVPILYFYINLIGVIFIQRNVAYERSKVENSESVSEVDIYLLFACEYGITDRELEIIRYIAGGYSNPEISKKLFISPNTVKNHIYNIYKKVGIKNRYELISILSQMQNPA